MGSGNTSNLFISNREIGFSQLNNSSYNIEYEISDDSNKGDSSAESTDEDFDNML